MTKKLKGSPMSRLEIRNFAMTLREICGYENKFCFPVVRFLENILPEIIDGFNYEIVEDDSLKYEYGKTNIDNKTITLKESVYNGALNNNGRDLFTIAHEIGHLIFHNNDSITLSRTEEKIPAYMDPEWQANTFAGELLAPPILIKDLTTDEVAKKCNVSYQVASIQKRYC